jgi:hypothetical protein
MSQQLPATAIDEKHGLTSPATLLKKKGYKPSLIKRGGLRIRIHPERVFT